MSEDSVITQISFHANVINGSKVIRKHIQYSPDEGHVDAWTDTEWAAAWKEKQSAPRDVAPGFNAAGTVIQWTFPLHEANVFFAADNAVWYVYLPYGNEELANGIIDSVEAENGCCIPRDGVKSKDRNDIPELPAWYD